MKRKLIVFLCIVLAVTTVFAACGGSATPAPSESAATESKPATAESTAPEASTGGDTAAAGDKINIVFIPKNLGNPYFEAIDYGFKQAIDELGADKFNYSMTGPAEADATSQIEYVEAAVQNGTDIIFIAANSNDALNGTFDDAREAGTKIILINQDIPGSEDHRDGAIMPCDFTTVGISQLELLGSMINYEGDFAILSATTDAPDQNTWIDGMKAELESNSKFAKMNLVEVVYGDDQPEKSTTEMEALITKYPDLRGVIAPTTVGVAAAAKVIQNKGLADKIKLTGLGLPSEMKEFILDGSCPAMQLWNPPYEGYLAIYLAQEIANGFEIKSGASFEAGKLESYTFNDTNQVITLPTPMTYDKSNIEEYAALF
jgi:rhamnose transport system substrate-binding protein